VTTKINDLLKKVIAFVVHLSVSKNGEDIQVSRYQGRDSWVAAASYIPLASMAILVLRKNNSDFVLEHAKQSLILFILLILVLILLPGIIKFLPGFAISTLMIGSAYLSFTGRRVHIPWVSEVSRLISI